MTDDPSDRLDRLETRVRELETEVARLRLPDDTPTAAPLPPLSHLPPPTGVPLRPPGAPPFRGAEGREFTVESETVLKWGGVALVVLAVGFAVSTAISRGWIGPELQLAGAVAISLGLIGVGLRLRSTRLPWTHALCTGGVAALFTTVGSNLFIEEAGADAAFTSTVAIGIGGYALARTIPSEWVATANLGAGTVAWLVIADGELPFEASLAWFVGLVAVALVLSLDRRWFGLRFSAHGVGLLAILGMAGDSDTSTEQGLVLVAAVALAGSLLRLPSVGALSSLWQELEIQLAVLMAPWALAVIGLTLDIDGETAGGWTAIAVAAATTAVAVVVRRWILPAHFVSVLIGASVALSIGLALLLSTTVTFVALAVQGAGLIILSRSLGRSVRMLVNAAILLFVAGAFVAGASVEAWTENAAIGDDIAHLTIIATIALALWQSRDNTTQRLGAAVVLILVLVWLGSVLVHLPQGQAAVSVSWAIVGTAVLVTGAVRKVPPLGAAGLAVLAVTVGKLLTVDLREVDTLWRAGLFLVIGLGLMRLGFLLPRLTGTADETGGRMPDGG